MRYIAVIGWVISIALGVDAAILDFSTTGGSLGASLDNKTASGGALFVPEISDLKLTYTVGVPEPASIEFINAVSSRIGVNSDLADEGSSYFDPGEWLAFSFDKDVRITRFDFTDFTTGDSVRISHGDLSVELTVSDLNSDKEYLVDWTLRATDLIKWEALGKSGATSTGGFGLGAMDLTVVPEPVTMSLLGIGAGALCLARRKISI